MRPAETFSDFLNRATGINRRLEVLDIHLSSFGAFVNVHQNTSLARCMATIRVLELDPVRRTASAIGAFAAFGPHSFKTERARLLEQVPADLALFEFADERSPSSRRPSRRARLFLR
jgi:hypothetical protein